jgi:hypothetical protein
MLLSGLIHTQITAMEHIPTEEKTNTEKNDTIIDISRCWSSSYTKDVVSIKNINLEHILSHLKTENHLPNESDPLTHLLYLSTIQKNDACKSPFTETQQHKFDMIIKTKQKVRFFFKLNYAVIVGTTLLMLTALIGMNQCTDPPIPNTSCLSANAVIILPTIFTMAGTLILEFFSQYSTGILPDVSARKADKMQEQIQNMKRNNLKTARYWLDIYFKCPDKAKDIAKKFDIDELKTRATLKTKNKNCVITLINPLEEAHYYIMNNDVPATFTDIGDYIYLKITHTRLKAIEKVLFPAKKNSEDELIKENI